MARLMLDFLGKEYPQKIRPMKVDINKERLFETKSDDRGSPPCPHPFCAMHLA